MKMSSSSDGRCFPTTASSSAVLMDNDGFCCHQRHPRTRRANSSSRQRMMLPVLLLIMVMGCVPTRFSYAWTLTKSSSVVSRMVAHHSPFLSSSTPRRGTRTSLFRRTTTATTNVYDRRSSREGPSSPLFLSGDASDNDDEWHPHDPAHTTPQLLAGIWWQIAQGTTMVKGVSPYKKG